MRTPGLQVNPFPIQAKRGPLRNGVRGDGSVPVAHLRNRAPVGNTGRSN